MLRSKPYMRANHPITEEPEFYLDLMFTIYCEPSHILVSQFTT